MIMSLLMFIECQSKPNNLYQQQTHATALGSTATNLLINL